MTRNDFELMTASELEGALERFPRRVLASYPTELQHLDRLSDQLGRPVWIKRDDRLGPLVGGNKTRKLEYLLAQALDQGHERIVTIGGAQSNHARLTAAAARLLGLEPHLLLMGNRPKKSTGNLLLDELVDAHLHFVRTDSVRPGRCTFEELDGHLRDVARDRVGDHYFIPIGGSNWLGSLGYIGAALELDRQTREAGLEHAWVVSAAGSGGTFAGLVAGLALLGSTLRPLGIDIGKLWTDFPQHVCRLVEEVCEHLGSSLRCKPSEIPLVERRYAGRRYGVPTDEGTAAIRRLARIEGVVLDGTYTGKAFAGLLDLAKSGRLGKEDPIIFVHTGGLPGFFA